ncbi:MAG: hypothetical protein EBU88_18250, partial [Acidobacteria bacterium]|nr:hypothetical protein [Acidobacteriota bacterium]
MLSTGQSDHLKLPAILLRLLSVVYEAVVRVRLAFYRYGLVSIQSLPQRVISVGNLTV